MKGTRSAINLDMNATSRLSLSSFATRLERIEGSFQPRVTRHVSGEDRSETAADSPGSGEFSVILVREPGLIPIGATLAPETQQNRRTEQ
jgi:hypothetical protein